MQKWFYITCYCNWFQCDLCKFSCVVLLLNKSSPPLWWSTKFQHGALTAAWFREKSNSLVLSTVNEDILTLKHKIFLFSSQLLTFIVPYIQRKKSELTISDNRLLCCIIFEATTEWCAKFCKKFARNFFLLLHQHQPWDNSNFDSIERLTNNIIIICNLYTAILQLINYHMTSTDFASVGVMFSLLCIIFGQLPKHPICILIIFTPLFVPP